MVRRHGLLLLCALIGGGPLTAGVARADAPPPSAANEENAQSAFAEGLRLRDQDGKPKEALPKFAAAHSLVATARTTFELGKTHLMLGQLVEARALFTAVGRLPPETNESPAAAQARAESARLQGELTKRIPALVFKTTGDASKAQVTVDGVVVPSAALSIPWKVNPGAHAVVLKVQGAADQTQSVTAKEGENLDVPLVVRVVVTPVASARPPPAAPPPKTPPPDPKPVSNRGRTQRTIGLVAGGTGVAALGVGTVFGILASGANKDSQQHCGTAIMVPPGRCDPAGITAHDSAVSKATLSTVFVIAGGVLAAGGAALWFTAPKPGGVQVGISPTGAVVGGVF